ncbi:Xanthine/uracil/vitamin C permease [Cunninghamella echinulata]|nr:Xanthine/uracil/vitamin C permease [Cunninghamella echinulata]
MFSGTIFVPALFFSGISTMLFFIITKGRIPAYLGSSGSAISAVLTITQYKYQAGLLNPDISLVQGALVTLGLIYMTISFLVMIFGYKIISAIMPPVVTGSIVASIGIHLIFSSYRQVTSTSFDTYMALATVLSIMIISIYAPLPLLRRLCLLLGTIIGYIIHLICGIKGIGKSIDFSQVASSPWFSAPQIHSPVIFDPQAISTMAPVVIVLLAENMGHLKALSSITENSLDHYLGRTYLGDAISIIMCGSVGTSPMTTYAENLIMLKVTNIYSPLVILFAAFVAVILGFISKFGAIVKTIPEGVFGGTSIILYTYIFTTGIKIWLDNKIDFSDPRNIFIGGLPLMLAAIIQEEVKLNSFQLDGIGAATFSSIILYQLLRGVDGFKECANSMKLFFTSHKHKKRMDTNV